MTMAAVGAELGVTPGALYRYFPDRAAVLEALASEAAANLEAPSEDLPWRAWLSETARRQRALWRDHPEMEDLLPTVALGVAGTSLLRRGIDVLTAQGFEPRAAIMALSLVAQVAHSSGLVEAREGRRKPSPDYPPYEDLAELIGSDNDALFEELLAVTIAGIAATYGP